MTLVAWVRWVRAMQGRREPPYAGIWGRLRTKQRACPARPGDTDFIPVRALRGSAPHAQHLGDRPGLVRAAGRDVRRRAVRRLGDRAEPPLAEVRFDPAEDPVDIAADAPGGVEVGAEEPRPDGALVVRRVALRGPAAVI